MLTHLTAVCIPMWNLCQRTISWYTDYTATTMEELDESALLGTTNGNFYLTKTNKLKKLPDGSLDNYYEVNGFVIFCTKMFIELLF